LVDKCNKIFEGHAPGSVKYSIISIYITQSVSAVKLITKDKFAEVYRLRLKENEVPESSKYKLKISTRKLRESSSRERSVNKIHGKITNVP